MNLTKISRLSILALSLAGVVSISRATPVVTAMTGPDIDGVVSFDGVQRSGWLTTSVGGYVVSGTTGTPQAANVGSLFGDTWLKEGELTAVGSNDLLTVSLTQGSWGTGPLTGEWNIDPSFWSTYGRAVISLHVGNGAGDPDWFLWEIAPGETNGTFHYERISGGGGGLSNIFLWGGDGQSVPDGGATAIMVGLGLIAITFFRPKLR